MKKFILIALIFSESSYSMYSSEMYNNPDKDLGKNPNYETRIPSSHNNLSLQISKIVEKFIDEKESISDPQQYAMQKIYDFCDERIKEMNEYKSDIRTKYVKILPNFLSIIEPDMQKTLSNIDHVIQMLLGIKIDLTEIMTIGVQNADSNPDILVQCVQNADSNPDILVQLTKKYIGNFVAKNIDNTITLEKLSKNLIDNLIDLIEIQTNNVQKEFEIYQYSVKNFIDAIEKLVAFKTIKEEQEEILNNFNN
jgi:hypothetical protein